MTHRNDITLPAELMEQVQEQGLDVLPELIRIVTPHLRWVQVSTLRCKRSAVNICKPHLINKNDEATPGIALQRVDLLHFPSVRRC